MGIRVVDRRAGALAVSRCPVRGRAVPARGRQGCAGGLTPTVVAAAGAAASELERLVAQWDELQRAGQASLLLTAYTRPGDETLRVRFGRGRVSACRDQAPRRSTADRCDRRPNGAGLRRPGRSVQRAGRRPGSFARRSASSSRSSARSTVSLRSSSPSPASIDATSLVGQDLGRLLERLVFIDRNQRCRGLAIARNEDMIATVRDVTEQLTEMLRNSRTGTVLART